MMMKISLGGRFDDLLIALQLGGHGHVHETIANSNHHSSNDGGIHFVVDLTLLSGLDKRGDGRFDFLGHGSIQRLKSKDINKIMIQKETTKAKRYKFLIN